MENRRLRVITRITFILVIVASLINQGYYGVQKAYAWNNVGVHSTINESAYASFVGQWMPYDQYLKLASLDGKPVSGESWEPRDGTSWTDRILPVTRQKSVKDWISEGGFSADEPELSMSLLHFYDPVGEPHYLTDTINDIPLSIGKWYNPKTDMFQWGFESITNPFSFSNGEYYYQTALANTDPNNINYGKAWRSVGETMHLLSDMTVPAHVRNDGHIPYGNLYDPLEYFTHTSDVDVYGTGYPATTDFGDYHTAYSTGKDIRTLFKQVATWTSTNFFSRDTVSQYKSDTTPNRKKAYASPAVSIDPAFTGYYTTSLNGNSQFPLARASISGILFKTPTLVVDQNVCAAQRSILIPTSIKASAAVMDAFLPRFQVIIDSVQPDEKQVGDYVVTAHIKQIPTREWTEILTIRNGAHVMVDSTDLVVTLDNNLDNDQNLNALKFKVTAKDGSLIKVYYDLGGYKISSAPFKVIAPSPSVSSKISGPINLTWSYRSIIPPGKVIPGAHATGSWQVVSEGARLGNESVDHTGFTIYVKKNTPIQLSVSAQGSLDQNQERIEHTLGNYDIISYSIEFLDFSGPTTTNIDKDGFRIWMTKMPANVSQSKGNVTLNFIMRDELQAKTGMGIEIKADIEEYDKNGTLKYKNTEHVQDYAIGFDFVVE